MTDPQSLPRPSGTVFYGSCASCGRGYWAEVITGPEKAMCGPYVQIVCQAHHPVSDVELGNFRMFSADDRKAWEKWRKEADSAAT